MDLEDIKKNIEDYGEQTGEDIEETKEKIEEFTDALCKAYSEFKKEIINTYEYLVGIAADARQSLEDFGEQAHDSIDIATEKVKEEATNVDEFVKEESDENCDILGIVVLILIIGLGLYIYSTIFK